MNWDSTSTLRSQLRAIAEAKTEAEAYEMFASRHECAIGTWRLIFEKRKQEPGLDIREAAKRAEGSL